MPTIASVSDFRTLARRRIPRFAFDYLDGGAGDEIGVRRNIEAFDALQLMPRMLVNVEKLELSTTLFGRNWNMPFGTAPIGVGNLMWPRAEATIAQAALAANIPYTISTPACTSLEDIREIAGENAWFQLYVGRAEAMVEGLVERAQAAGYDVMLVTVDVPVPPRRLRDIRNHFTMPFAWSPWVIWQLAIHPEWSIRTAIAGRPRFANMERYAPMQGVQPLARYMSSQVTGRFDWDALKKLRDRWRGKLVPKGLLSVEDCVKAKAIGCDGIVVSNHGGRQLGSLPASIDVIGEIRAAVGKEFPLILDSGIRSGEHIVKALASGADFCLIGRAMIYAIAGLGAKGPTTVLDLLRDEMLQTLGQIGYPTIAELKAAAPVRR
jgi:isopentenyl diphosphate isomerase/L-lactate dehydrogenase-like FMN-dependent dehydrogenase